MELLRKKHRQTYVNGLNAAEEAYAKTDSPKERIKLPSALKFNGGGHILGSAIQISSQYPDLVALYTRQVVSALDPTVSTDSKGNILPGDFKPFMENTGEPGGEHIFAAFPTCLYLNTPWGGTLLGPLLKLQDRS
ncbi:hypothetical protein BD309DRAFT_1023229 [Dichomitus squalens]|uniref:superoxide dismutase n=1 Tax=Dichomitus squalens TaxID=114155 RepID=A0A4Q9P9N1_9APHY|nr:hypothetical protein BD311DRAFT_812541 [Dichomitus squalens]TBU37937.1 hypothetical protein BD309DRAFT_1023229 [Dichomitus squalens]TBU51370.1 hypothetical protein BD310DRAFT_982668 [Dichomitus squalens]